MTVMYRVEALAALADEHALGLPTLETPCARLGISRATAYRSRRTGRRQRPPTAPLPHVSPPPPTAIVR